MNGVTVRERVLCPGQSAGGTASWKLFDHKNVGGFDPVDIQVGHLQPDVHLLVIGLGIDPLGEWRHLDWKKLQRKRMVNVSRCFLV